MDRKRVEAEVPDGTRLGFAQGTDGGMRGLLFDEQTGKLVGHAALFEYDEGDDNDFGYSGSPQDGGDLSSQHDEDIDVVIEIISQVLTNLAIYGIEKAAPHVKDWWNDKAAPALKEKAVPALKSAPGKVKSALTRSKHPKNAGNGTTADVVTRSDPEPSDHADDGAIVGKAFGPVMTSTEAQQRLARAVAAMAFAREQMRDLHNATIVDDDGSLALADLLNQITPQHVEKAIRLTLEANPLMLDRPNPSAFTISLGMGQPDGAPLPLSRGGQLRTAGGEEAPAT